MDLLNETKKASEEKKKETFSVWVPSSIIMVCWSGQISLNTQPWVITNMLGAVVTLTLVYVYSLWENDKYIWSVSMQENGVHYNADLMKNSTLKDTKHVLYCNICDMLNDSGQITQLMLMSLCS